jgi:hypothetical protein
MIHPLLRVLGRLYYRLFGNKRLTSIERLTLDAWRGELSARTKEILDAQLQAAVFAQRQAGGLKICFYYPDLGAGPVFRDQRPDLHVATVILTDAQAPGSEMKVKVFLHRGRVFSLEFPKRPWRYLELHEMHSETLRAERVKSLVELE